MAGNFGLGGTTGTSGRRGSGPGYQPTDKRINDQNGLYDPLGRYVSPGLRAPGGGEFQEFVPGSGVPNTSQGMMINKDGQWVPSSNGSDFVGIPYGSSLYIQAQGKKGQTKTFRADAGLSYNTYTAFNNFFAQEESEIKKFQKQLVNLGYLTESDINGRWGHRSDPKTRAALAQLMYEGNLSGRAWFDVLTQGSAGIDGSGSGPGGSGPSYPYTTVQKQKTISTMQDARLILRQTMQQMLGREPTGDEVKGFLAELNQQERENPDITRTTYKSETKSTQVNKGGFEPSAFAEEYVEEEYPGQFNKFQQESYEDMALASIRSL